MAGALPQGIAWPSDNSLHPVESWRPSTFHAYVHVPFCRVRCGYCDFNTYTADELRGSTRESFHEAILKEIDFSASVFANSNQARQPLKSIFFGGGTPTLFEPKQFKIILDRLTETFGLEADVEISVEANPDTVNLEYLSDLQQTGVNRISYGVQSFDREVLQVLDRSHDPDAVARVVAEAHQVGLRTSIDLIYGTPGESLRSWQSSLQRAIDLGTGHISAYSLIVEAGTKLASRIKRGELADIDSDFQADCYEVASELLRLAGFDWYEVSNWSRGVTQQSVHNIAYWQSRDWWGYGPGSHSHYGGNRWWNAKHPATYQKLLTDGNSPAVGREILTRRQILEEKLLLELRTTFGVELDVLRELEISPKLTSFEIANGNLQPLARDRISVTEKGRLVADAVVLRLLSTD